MKKTLNLSLSYIIIFVLIIFSTTNLVKALIDWDNINKAVDINAIDSTEIKVGRFVDGTMKDYLVRPDMGLGLPATGNQAGVIILDGEFDIYTIKTLDDKYVLLRIKDKENLEKLYDVEEFFNSDGIPIEAKFVSNEFSINYEWLKNALGFKTDAEVDEVVIGELVLQEVDFSTTAQRLREFSVLTLVSIAIFFANGGVKNLIIDTNPRVSQSIEEQNLRVMTSEHNNYSNHELVYSLKKYKLDLEALSARRESQKRKAKLGVLWIILGSLSIYITMKIMYFPIAIGLVFFYYAIKYIWTFFINSNSGLARKVAIIFQIYTLQDELNKTLKYLAMVEKKIADSD